MMDRMPIKTENCSVLTLVLTRKWFDLILSGEKKQEYRTSDRILAQIERWFGHAAITGKSLVVKFCLGYGKKRNEISYAAERPFVAVGSKCPEWGEPEAPHYVIPLLYRVELS